MRAYGQENNKCKADICILNNSRDVSHVIECKSWYIHDVLSPNNKLFNQTISDLSKNILVDKYKAKNIAIIFFSHTLNETNDRYSGILKYQKNVKKHLKNRGTGLIKDMVDYIEIKFEKPQFQSEFIKISAGEFLNYKVDLYFYIIEKIS